MSRRKSAVRRLDDIWRTYLRGEYSRRVAVDAIREVMPGVTVAGAQNLLDDHRPPSMRYEEMSRG